MVIGSVPVVDSKSSLTKIAEASKFEFHILMKLLRNRKGISARNLSTSSGLSPAYVSKMESGSLIPTLDAFSRIIANLDCSDAEVVFVIRSLNNNKENLSNL